jgi:hypothetical protein
MRQSTDKQTDKPADPANRFQKTDVVFFNASQIEASQKKSDFLFLFSCFFKNYSIL